MNYFQYVMGVGVGNPPTYYSLVVDTSSSITFIGYIQLVEVSNCALNIYTENANRTTKRLLVLRRARTWKLPMVWNIWLDRNVRPSNFSWSVVWFVARFCRLWYNYADTRCCNHQSVDRERSRLYWLAWCRWHFRSRPSWPNCMVFVPKCHVTCSYRYGQARQQGLIQ